MSPLARPLMLLFALLALALAVPGPAAAAGQPGDPPRLSRDLALCIARIEPGMTPARAITNAGRFDCTTPQKAHGPGNYYAVSEPLDLPAGREYRARSASLWIGGMGLHALYDDGKLVSILTNNAGISRNIQLGAMIEYRLPARDAKLVRLMWEAERSPNLRGIVLGARIVDPVTSAESNLGLGALYAGFAGLCIALIIYNLALWVALRHGFQLAYCWMAGSLLLYAFTSSGALAWVVDDLANNDRLRLNHALLAFAGVGGLWFARSFFEPRIFQGWLGRASTIAIAMVGGVGLFTGLFLPLAPRFWDQAYSLLFFAGLLMLVPTVWRAARMRSRYAVLFAVAWSAPFLTAIARGLANLGLIPWNFWIDNSTILAMAVEAMLTSVVIVVRVRGLIRERDDARASESIARRLADTDALTGLLNRRAFLEQAIGRADRWQLLLADLDHFKQVNDTLGHDGGDEVLRVFARVLRHSVPGGTLVARIGGEEFAILAPVERPVDPGAILERLRATRMPFDLAVTASIGECMGPIASEADWKRLYRGADSALFSAKSSGRDCARTGNLSLAA